MVKQRTKLKKLKIPYYPIEENGNKGHYRTNTLEEKLVADYAGYNFKQINNLNVLEYWLLVRDALIHEYMKTVEGQEYLENCWRIEQVNPDREKLREKVGKEVNHG
jgi:hypothetical protein